VSRGPAPGTEPLPRTCRSKEALACADAGYAARRRSLSLWRDGPGLPWGHPDFVLASALRLRHQVLGQLPVAHADHDDPQAVIPGRRVELRELALVLFHALYTHEGADSFTS